MRPAMRKLPAATSVLKDRVPTVKRIVGEVAEVGDAVIREKQHVGTEKSDQVLVSRRVYSKCEKRSRTRNATPSPSSTSPYLHLYPRRILSSSTPHTSGSRQTIRNAAYAAALRDPDEGDDLSTNTPRFDPHLRGAYDHISGHHKDPANSPMQQHVYPGGFEIAAHRNRQSADTDYEIWFGEGFHQPYPFHTDDVFRFGIPFHPSYQKVGDRKGEAEPWSQTSIGSESGRTNVEQSTVSVNLARRAPRVSEGWTGDQARAKAMSIMTEETPSQGFPESRAGNSGQRRIRSAAEDVSMVRRRGAFTKQDKTHASSAPDRETQSNSNSAAESKAIIADHHNAPLSQEASSRRWGRIKEELMLPFDQAKGIQKCLMSRFRANGRPGLHVATFFSLFEMYGVEEDWLRLVGFVERLRGEVSLGSPEQDGSGLASEKESRRMSQSDGLSVQAHLGLARWTKDLSSLDTTISRLVGRVAGRDVRSILLPALLAYCSLADGLDRSVEADKLIARHLNKLTCLTRGGASAGKSTSQQEVHFRDTVFARLRTVADPLAWHQAVTSSLQDELPMRFEVDRRAADLMVLALASGSDTVRTGLDLSDELHRRGVGTGSSAAATLWRSLSKTGDWDSAIRLHARQMVRAEAASSRTIVLQEGIELFVGAGKVAEASALANQLLRAGQTVHRHRILRLMSTLKQAERYDEALVLSRLSFPSLMKSLESGQQQENSLDEDGRDVAHEVFSRVLSIHVAAGNMDGVDLATSAITRMGRKFKLVDHNIMLDLFARRGNVQAGLGVQKEMVAAGIEPDTFSINALVGLCARHQEPEAAENLYRRAIAHGIRLDPITANTVINGHIEAGDFDSATALWKELDPETHQNHPSIMTSLIKGMVRLGAPFAEVRRTILIAFDDLAHAPIRCWTLLIMSACDADNLQEAESLYADLALHDRQGHPELRINAYAGSALMAALLRNDALTAAVKVYHDLLARDISPPAVVHAIITKAISDAKWPVAQQLDAAKFVEGLVVAREVALDSTPKRRRGDIETLIAPLILAGGRSLDATRSRSWFRRALKQEGNSMNLRIALLDANAKAGRTDDVKAEWRNILALATGSETTSSSLAETQSLRMRIAVKQLRVPLSIFVNSMSEAGMHEEVDRAWHDLIAAGLVPDARNWNHIMIAQLRAGRIEEAFRVCEDVLIPSQEEVQAREIRSLRPIEFELGGADREASVGSLGLTGLTASARGSAGRRQYRDDREGDALRAYLRERRRADREEEHESTEANFARAKRFRSTMAILDRWRPGDVGKAPFGSTIAALDHVYRELELGRPVLKVASRKKMLALVSLDEEADLGEVVAGAEAITVAHLEADIDEDHREAAGTSSNNGATPPPGTESRQRQSMGGPLALLAKIDKRYAKTVSLISLYRRKKQGQSGARRAM